MQIELEQEVDGRWIAEVIEPPSVLAYGESQDEAVERAVALAQQMIEDRLQHGEAIW